MNVFGSQLNEYQQKENGSLNFTILELEWEPKRSCKLKLFFFSIIIIMQYLEGHVQ
jgi:hypothetical protein